MWDEIIVKIIVIDLVSCFYKASDDCFAIVGGKICHTFFVGQHDVLQTIIDGTTSGHKMSHIVGIRTCACDIIVFGFKEFYSTIEYVLTLRGGSDTV